MNAERLERMGETRGTVFERTETKRSRHKNVGFTVGYRRELRTLRKDYLAFVAQDFSNYLRSYKISNKNFVENKRCFSRLDNWLHYFKYDEIKTLSREKKCPFD